MNILLEEAFDETLTELKNRYGFECVDFDESGPLCRRVPGHPRLETVLRKVKRQADRMEEQFGGCWSKAEWKKMFGPFLEEEFHKYFQQVERDFLQARPDHEKNAAVASVLKQTYFVQLDLETAMQIAVALNRSAGRTHKYDPFHLSASDLKELAAENGKIAAALAVLKEREERRRPLPLP